MRRVLICKRLREYEVKYIVNAIFLNLFLPMKNGYALVYTDRLNQVISMFTEEVTISLSKARLKSKYFWITDEFDLGAKSQS